MKCYQVGGAVRDELLGINVKDRDWVVVGSSIQEMLDLGYKMVGKDFPVFLHPKTHEEYALARTERKNGVGYKGFTVYVSPDISLEDDLLRRDFTINALAKSSDGSIIDPYNGLRDLELKLLRHVSPAFSEDPLRVIRACRFLAKLDGFRFAEETVELIKKMVSSGELSYLSRERLSMEVVKGIESKYLYRMFEQLHDMQCLSYLSKILENNYLEFLKTKEEIGINKLTDLGDRLVYLLCMFDKELAISIFNDLGMAKRYFNRLISSICLRSYMMELNNLNPGCCLDLFYKLDIWRNKEAIEASLPILRSRNLIFADKLEYIRSMQYKLKDLDYKHIINTGDSVNIKELIRSYRLKAMHA